MQIENEPNGISRRLGILKATTLSSTLNSWNKESEAESSLLWAFRDTSIGTVAYHLNLPPGSAIHPAIHVYQLKKHISRDQVVSPTLPITGPEGNLRMEPQLILARRMIKRNNAAVPPLLIKWSNLKEEDASWEVN
jgi:hypothetical protein